MKKNILLMSLLVLLSSCYYDPQTGCWHHPDNVTCPERPEVTTIQEYQKPETIGHTDVEQRKKDFFACGVKNYFNGNLDFNTCYEGMACYGVDRPDNGEIDVRSQKIHDCIKKKGYRHIKYLDSEGCINYATNKLTGKCN